MLHVYKLTLNMNGISWACVGPCRTANLAFTFVYRFLFKNGGGGRGSVGFAYVFVSCFSYSVEGELHNEFHL